MGIKLTAGGKIVMKGGKLACSCCSLCSTVPEETFQLTVGAFTCTVSNAVSITANPPTGDDPDGGWGSGCVWQWIGDAASSSAYDAGGPDIITLARFYNGAEASYWWTARFGLTADLTTGYVNEYKAVDGTSPVGDYTGGYVVIS